MNRPGHVHLLPGIPPRILIGPADGRRSTKVRPSPLNLPLAILDPSAQSPEALAQMSQGLVRRYETLLVTLDLFESNLVSFTHTCPFSRKTVHCSACCKITRRHRMTSGV